jgi:hypothetical protein
VRISLKAMERPYQAAVELSPTETLALRAALGEVCFGFHVPDFEIRMGNTENQAEQLFKKMDRLSNDRQDEINLTMKEIRLLKKAHEETLRELAAEEYETRTGVDFAFGRPS